MRLRFLFVGFLIVLLGTVPLWAAKKSTSSQLAKQRAELKNLEANLAKQRKKVRLLERMDSKNRTFILYRRPRVTPRDFPLCTAR